MLYWRCTVHTDDDGHPVTACRHSNSSPFSSGRFAVIDYSSFRGRGCMLSAVTMLRMRLILASCVLILSVGQPALAQDKPDFSGDWILVNRRDAPTNAAQSITVHESFKRESVRGT